MVTPTFRPAPPVPVPYLRHFKVRPGAEEVAKHLTDWTVSQIGCMGECEAPLRFRTAQNGVMLEFSALYLSQLWPNLFTLAVPIVLDRHDALLLGTPSDATGEVLVVLSGLERP